MYIKFNKYFITIIIFILSFGAFSVLAKNYEKILVSDLSKSVIRFHILANSDETYDQLLKMQVKNAVIDFMEQNLTDVHDTKDAAIFLKNNTKKITTIARQVIHDNGYDYNVSASLGNSDFPDKSYGDVTFPAGNYNSFIVKIGNAEGHNWWCVLYPPLCFVDASTGVLPDESKETLKSSISETEYNYVTDNSENNSASVEHDTAIENSSINEDNDIKYEFKYFTFLNNLFH